MDKETKKGLKSRAHHLKPVVTVGQKSLTDSVLEEINLALDHHELIKIKINAGDREMRQSIISDICKKTGADLIQSIGHIAAVYRESEKN